MRQLINLKKIVAIVITLIIVTLSESSLLMADSYVMKKSNNGSGNLVINNNQVINIPNVYDTNPNNKKPKVNEQEKNNTNDIQSENQQQTDEEKSRSNNVSSSDDILVGKINNEITNFSTWLRVKKDNKKYPQENNYVAKNEIVTYIIESYNGKSEKTQQVTYRLTIPKNVEIINIGKDGKMVSEENNISIIEWKNQNIESKKINSLSVKVKFLEDTELENSQDISREFYSKLEIFENDNKTESYIRQLFIDNNSSKVGTVKKYIDIFDSTNSVRPDDEITRAEFAKMIADSGIIKIELNTQFSNKYSDEKEIPSYAKYSFMTLLDLGIIDAYSDNTLKPNNPILRDELFEMIIEISKYISDGKLANDEPPIFINTKVVNDDNARIQDDIMELLRQNIISDNSGMIKLNEYVKRSEVVNMINALTFRGPFINKGKINTLKFTEIMDNSYFYDLLNASNTYDYNYTKNLWQNVLEVK